MREQHPSYIPPLRPDRLPVPVSNVATSARLIMALSSVENAAKRAKNERDLQEYGEKVVRETLAYESPLTGKIKSGLFHTTELLATNGYVFPDYATSNELDKFARELTRERAFRAFRPDVIDKAG